MNKLFIQVTETKFINIMSASKATVTNLGKNEFRVVLEQHPGPENIVLEGEIAFKFVKNHTDLDILL